MPLANVLNLIAKPPGTSPPFIPYKPVPRLVPLPGHHTLTVKRPDSLRAFAFGDLREDNLQLLIQVRPDRCLFLRGGYKLFASLARARFCEQTLIIMSCQGIVGACSLYAFTGAVRQAGAASDPYTGVRWSVLVSITV